MPPADVLLMFTQTEIHVLGSKSKGARPHSLLGDQTMPSRLHACMLCAVDLLAKLVAAAQEQGVKMQMHVRQKEDHGAAQVLMVGPSFPRTGACSSMLQLTPLMQVKELLGSLQAAEPVLGTLPQDVQPRPEYRGQFFDAFTAALSASGLPTRDVSAAVRSLPAWSTMHMPGPGSKADCLADPALPAGVTSVGC
jgi:hypothetical protein